MEIVTVDIGGTHARFALAQINDGKVTRLDAGVTLKTAEYASLQTAWEAFGAQAARPLPRAIALAVACPVTGEVLKLSNNPWIIRPALIEAKLGVDVVTLVNDFGAIGHAVGELKDGDLRHICGPEVDLPSDGVISIVGPGTGLGVAHVLRRDGVAHVISGEGGHIDYAPLDSIEDAILSYLRQRYRRVSIERLVSGPGLLNIYEALARIEGRPAVIHEDKALWQTAIAGGDSLATAALDRFCRIMGSVAGDIALVHGANAVLIAGGIGPRIAELLPPSGFAERFSAKGRFEAMMGGLPVKLITHPQLGLLGAAAAFAKEHQS